MVSGLEGGSTIQCILSVVIICIGAYTFQIPEIHSENSVGEEEGGRVNQIFRGQIKVHHLERVCGCSPNLGSLRSINVVYLIICEAHTYCFFLHVYTCSSCTRINAMPLTPKRNLCVCMR